MSYLFEELVKAVMIKASVMAKFYLILGRHRGNRNHPGRKVKEVVNHRQRENTWKDKTEVWCSVRQNDLSHAHTHRKLFRVPYWKPCRSIRSCGLVQSQGTAAHLCYIFSTLRLFHRCSPGESTGEFNFFAKRSYMHEHHQLTEYLNSSMLLPQCWNRSGKQIQHVQGWNQRIGLTQRLSCYAG